MNLKALMCGRSLCRIGSLTTSWIQRLYGILNGMPRGSSDALRIGSHKHTPNHGLGTVSGTFRYAQSPVYHMFSPHHDKVITARGREDVVPQTLHQQDPTLLLWE